MVAGNRDPECSQKQQGPGGLGGLGGPGGLGLEGRAEMAGGAEHLGPKVLHGPHVDIRVTLSLTPEL